MNAEATEVGVDADGRAFGECCRGAGMRYADKYASGLAIGPLVGSVGS